jgi:hypothetical protein
MENDCKDRMLKSMLLVDRIASGTSSFPSAFQDDNSDHLYHHLLCSFTGQATGNGERNSQTVRQKKPFNRRLMQNATHA